VTNEQQIKLLGELADRFHKILGFATGQKILSSHPFLTPTMREHIVNEQMGVEIDKLAADGFEQCVRALVELGAPDVSIHECNPTEEP